MVKRCSHGLCKSDDRYPERMEGGVRFVPFPKPKSKEEKCLRWIKLCGRPHSQLNPSRINSNRYVCTKHFVNGTPSEEFPDPLPADPLCRKPLTRKAPMKRTFTETSRPTAAQEVEQSEDIISNPEKEDNAGEGEITSCGTQTTTNSLYHTPVVCCPTIEELTKLAEELRLKCTGPELEAIHDTFKDTAAHLTEISQIPEPSLPVNYPRVPGYRPAPSDNPYNAWYWRCDIKGAAKGKLAGKTIGIKDNVAIAGVPMSYGSTIMEGYTPEFDATIVTRVLDAGGRIMGKTSVEGLCVSGSSYTNSFGPVRNPYDETRAAGGSSGGSAALVSQGLVDMAVGGDQGGSIRIPSTFCGIVGLKPTHGLVPYTGAMPIEITLDHLGPMTRTVEDNALFLEVLAGYDGGKDPRQPVGLKVPEYSKLVNAGVKGKRIGVLKEGFDVCTEQDVAELVKKEVEKLKKEGAEVEEVSIPMHLHGAAIWSAICLQGAYNCMVKGNGNGYFWKGFYASSMQEAACRGYETRPYDMSLVMKDVTLVGEYFNRNYQNKFYAKGQNLNMTLTAEYDRALEKYDVLVMPTCPYKPSKLPKQDAKPPELLKIALDMVPNTSPFDCTGHPALSINAGYSDGLPVGMMIVGRHFDETSVYQVARAYEKIRD